MELNLYFYQIYLNYYNFLNVWTLFELFILNHRKRWRCIVHHGLRSTRFLARPSTWAGNPLLKSRGALADGTGRRCPVDSVDGRWRGSGGWRLERLRRAGNQFGGGNGIERSSPMLSTMVNLGGRGTPVREVGRRSLVRLAETWCIAGR
jgi:hypothetical protein